jgi:hypothetical protein
MIQNESAALCVEAAAGAHGTTLPVPGFLKQHACVHDVHHCIMRLLFIWSWRAVAEVDLVLSVRANCETKIIQSFVDERARLFKI